jgi:nucleoid-associated protein YgaU
VVELPSPFQKTDYREPEKIQKIVTEYNFLLLSQLEAQRAYFEDLVEKARLESAGPGETAALAQEVKRLHKLVAQQTQQTNQLKVKEERARDQPCGCVCVGVFLFFIIFVICASFLCRTRCWQ